MRIAFPYPGYWPYVRRGIERCIHDMAGFLAQRGHDVHVITSTPGRPRVAFDGEVKVTYVSQLSHPLVYRYGPGLRGLAFAAQASRVLAAERPQVACLWSLQYYALPWGPPMRRWLDIPYLTQIPVRGARLNLEPPRRPFRRLLTMEIRQANRLVTCTPGGAAEVEARLGVPCGVLPPPVDMAFFRPVSARAERPQVLFASDLLDPLKGGRLLLRAWNAVHRRCPEAVLLLAGPYGVAGYNQLPLAAIGQAIQELVAPGARTSVELRGPVMVDSLLPGLYSEASVTVLPSLGEAFGMVLTESLACGTPVVASSGEGPGEIVTNPEIGRTVELRCLSDFESEERADQLADAILSAIELAKSPHAVDRCREWASQWGLDRIGRDQEQMLEEIVEGHEQRRHAGA